MNFSLPRFTEDKALCVTIMDYKDERYRLEFYRPGNYTYVYLRTHSPQSLSCDFKESLQHDPVRDVVHEFLVLDLAQGFVLEDMKLARARPVGVINDYVSGAGSDDEQIDIAVFRVLAARE